MRSLVLAGLLLSALPFTAEAQSGTPVNVCGTLTAYRAAAAPLPGEVVVAGERFAISTDAARQNVHPAARAGTDVCLTGTWVMSQTVGRNLIDMTLAPRSAQMPSTATAATPSASSAVEIPVAAALVGLAVVAIVATRRAPSRRGAVRRRSAPRGSVG